MTGSIRRTTITKTLLGRAMPHNKHYSLTSTKHSLEEEINEANVPHEACRFEFLGELVDHEAQERYVDNTQKNVDCDEPASVSDILVPLAHSCTDVIQKIKIRNKLSPKLKLVTWSNLQRDKRNTFRYF